VISLDFVPLWTAILGLGVFLYVLLDGFDLGVGILYGFAPDTTSRNLVMNSIAPIWDGNETWLVLGGIALLAAFPLAFAVILPAVYFPIAVMLLALAFPALVSLCSGLLPQNYSVSRKHHFRAIADDLLVGSGHAVVAVTLLAHNAWLSLDAIARSLFRVTISRRHLLQWTTAAQAKTLAGLSFADFLWPLRGATAVAIPRATRVTSSMS